MKLKKSGINENILKKYSNKQTASLYKELDMVGYIREVSADIENKKFIS